ncbi:MAG: glucokinase [Deltaproteobacteria bacterium]|nr:glucokinase [Candidatus Zymogenaceae bacterium]
MILAGDIGGTKTKLGLFERGGDGLVCTKKKTYRSREHPTIFSILEDFIRSEGAIEAVCLGVAGPVEGGRVIATNLPWRFSVDQIASAVGTTGRVCLLNDLVALSLGTVGLHPPDIVPLKGGVADPQGVRAVIAAGTGLGQGYLVPTFGGEAFRALPSEGGHADFSPQTETEADLWRYLRKRFGRVSNERVVSGGGIVAIYEFLRDIKRVDPDPQIEKALATPDPNPVIARRAAGWACPIARATFDVFLSAYGAEAGDLALTLFATGGIYVGGGIARKNLPLIKSGPFIEAFLDKGRFRSLMERIPVWVVVNEDVEIIGAAGFAALNEKDNDAASSYTIAT